MSGMDRFDRAWEPWRNTPFRAGAQFGGGIGGIWGQDDGTQADDCRARPFVPDLSAVVVVSSQDPSAGNAEPVHPQQGKGSRRTRARK